MGKGQVGWYIIRVKDPAQAAEVAKRVDEEFENSSAETKTEPEGAFVQGWANQMGNIALITAAILGAVFFTILLVTGNTMAQAVRERTGEIGVLKAMGFTNGQVLALVLAESCLSGRSRAGCLGLGSGLALTSRGDPTGGMLPLFFFPTRDLVLGIGFSLGARGGRGDSSRPCKPCACAWPMRCGGCDYGWSYQLAFASRLRHQVRPAEHSAAAAVRLPPRFSASPAWWPCWSACSRSQRASEGP